MKLFTIGPTEMYENTRCIRENDIPYFRTSEFSEDVLLMDRLLKKQLQTAEDSKTIYLTASGTAAMEATVQNCFSKEDKILVIAGGSFGNRFAQICAIHGFKYEMLELEWDETLTEKHFEPFEDMRFTALLVNLHETATGQLYNIHIIKEFCERNNMYLVVDAISTFLCDEYKMDEWGIDTTIISTQKGLCVSPGMSMVIMNKRMVEERIKENSVASLYFDFKDYLLNIQRGQTPFTPAVGIVYEILDMLKYIDAYGLENRLADIAEMAGYYRENIVGEGIYIPSYPLSNAITPTFFNKPIAKKIFQKLKDEQGMVVNPTGGSLADISFRVSHVGNLSIQDHVQLVEKIKSMYQSQ